MGSAQGKGMAILEGAEERMRASHGGMGFLGFCMPQIRFAAFRSCAAAEAPPKSRPAELLGAELACTQGVMNQLLFLNACTMTSVGTTPRQAAGRRFLALRENGLTTPCEGPFLVLDKLRANGVEPFPSSVRMGLTSPNAHEKRTEPISQLVRALRSHVWGSAWDLE
jgi:hypothetical protein